MHYNAITIVIKEYTISCNNKHYKNVIPKEKIFDFSGLNFISFIELFLIFLYSGDKYKDVPLAF